MIMEKYPFSTFHEMNLDWILSEIARLKAELDKVGDIDEKIKELEEMLKNLYKALGEVIGMDLVDKSLFNLHAQVIGDKNSRFNASMTSQGFCIGEDGNGRPVAMNCFIDASSNSNEVIFTYFDNGQEIGRVTSLTMGHSNSCCYNKTTNMFYVACGGSGSSVPYVMPIALDGTLGNAISIDGRRCWAITWNQDRFYCLTDSGIPYKAFLYVCDNDFNIIDRYDFYEDENFTYQGLCSDDNFLYLLNGNTIMGDNIEHNINRCSVLTKDGVEIKQVIMAYPLEMEEADFYNGRMYLSSNSTHAAIIVETDMYVKNRHCAFGEPLDTTDLNKQINEIHVNESYMNFLMDGTSTHPLSAITLVILWLRNSTDRINLKIETDITQLINPNTGDIGTMAFRRVPNTIFDIDGGDHNLPNLLFDGGILYLHDAILPGVDSAHTIQFFGKRMVLNGVTFGESGSSIVPNRLIFCTSDFEIGADEKIVVNQDASWLIYALGRGYIRACDFNHATARYQIYADFQVHYRNFDIQRVKTGPAELFQEIPVSYSTYTLTLDMHSIRIPADISIVGGGSTSLSNLPSGVTTSTCRYAQVRPFRSNDSAVNTCIIYYMNDGTIVTDYFQAT